MTRLTAVQDLIDAVAEGLRISDRNHDAWIAARSALGRLQTALDANTERQPLSEERIRQLLRSRAVSHGATNDLQIAVNLARAIEAEYKLFNQQEDSDG